MYFSFTSPLRINKIVIASFALIVLSVLFVFPVSKASAVAEARLLVCPSTTLMNSNLPEVNANNYSYAGLFPATSAWDVFGRTATTSNWLRGGSNQGQVARYPGVQIGSGPWNKRHAAQGTYAAYYNASSNYCGDTSRPETLRGITARIVQDKFVATPSGSQDDVERASIRINSPWGDIRNFVNVPGDCSSTDCGAKVGFAKISLENKIDTKLENLQPNNVYNGRWQGTIQVFNPLGETYSNSAYFQNNNLLGCFAYSVTNQCNSNRVTNGVYDGSYSPRWNGGIGGDITAYTGQDLSRSADYINGNIKSIWRNGYNGSKLPDNATNVTYAPRRSFAADVYCNMDSSDYRFCTTYEHNVSLDGAAVGIRDFDAILTDTEMPLSNLGTVGNDKSNPVVSTWSGRWCNSGVCGLEITNGQQVPEVYWINAQNIVGNKTLRFKAMDAGFGITYADLRINGTYSVTGGSGATVGAAADDYSGQCTNYPGGWGQYRLDRAFEVPRTGSLARGTGSNVSTSRFTINHAPICSTSMDYIRGGVNLRAAPFQEGTNVATIRMRDFTRAGAGTVNETTENHPIKIDTVPPNVGIGLISSGGGNCYKAATGVSETSCHTINGNAAAGNSYIRGSIDFASLAVDPAGTLGATAAETHSGLSWNAYNNFYVNGAAVQSCQPVIISNPNMYSAAGYNSCSSSGGAALNTNSYANGASLMMQTQARDWAGNYGISNSKSFVIDNQSPTNTSSALSNSSITLSAYDAHSGTRDIQAVVQAAQPAASYSWTTPGTTYSPGTTANFAANSIVWVRSRDNIGNVSAWQKYDLNTPDATVYCDTNNISSNGWVKNQSIPCWIEASKQDTGVIDTVAMRYRPAASSNDVWTGTTNCTSNYSNDNNCYVWGGPSRSGEQNILGNEGRSGTGPYTSFYFDPVVYSGSNMTAGIMQTNGGYIGNNYEVLVQGMPAGNSPYNTWGDWIWNFSIPYNQRLATPRSYDMANLIMVDPSGRPNNVTLVASAYARKTTNNNWLFLPSGQTTARIGLAFVNSAGAAITGATDYTQMSTASTSGVWEKIQSKITIPLAQASAGFGLVPSSSGKPNNPGGLAGITGIDSLRISPQFLVPSGIQGVTLLQGMATQGGLNSSNAEYELKKDATPPALTHQMALSAETNNSNPEIKGEILEHEGEPKYAGYMRLGIRARDLFVGNASYIPNNFSIENSEKTAADAIKTAYNNVSSGVRSNWAQTSSGMANGAWVACSYSSHGTGCDNIPTDNRIDTTNNQLIGSDGNSRWFVIDQSNTGVDGACSGTLFNNPGDPEWYSCVFNVGLAPFKSDRRYAIRFRAEDQAGNVSYSSPQTFTTHPKCLAIIGVASP